MLLNMKPDGLAKLVTTMMETAGSPEEAGLLIRTVVRAVERGGPEGRDTVVKAVSILRKLERDGVVKMLRTYGEPSDNPSGEANDVEMLIDPSLPAALLILERAMGRQKIPSVDGLSVELGRSVATVIARRGDQRTEFVGELGAGVRMIFHAHWDRVR